ncbi:MAG: phage tail sheath family protein [Zetaproteobacteria bacterium CG_4_8_14_3_um_filter_59_5]|nr:MAG: phage tail sheath family protein [Zetaproteobacteria bacterium CG_4_8_14_3_um_filter_59_5]
MPTYLKPGVFVEEIRGRSQPLEAAGTSTAAFAGKLVQGPVGEPVLIRSWLEYEHIFGPVSSEKDTMGIAVDCFFRNGGSRAYVCRLPDRARASGYRRLFSGPLSRIADINIIILPGVCWRASGKLVLADAVAHCEAMGNRMVIIDLPDIELSSVSDVSALSLPASSFSVCYYPWVKISSPLKADRTISVPPSSFAAGLWSKVDADRGVWKTPAGLQAGLHGVSGLQYAVEDNLQDQLNPLGVNCLRNMPAIGPVIWGARTLSTRADPEWRYVPVRRTAIMIEQSIYNGIRWAVFEPNEHTLWSALRADIGGFMNGLFRAGAFQGEKASDAYFVRCGLGDTMTQADLDAGQVIVVVGFAPLKPAEFVIVRIQQKVNQP